MTDPAIAPYGAWASPIRIDDVVGDLIGLAEPWLDGDEIYWLEARPAEGGRRVLVRLALDGTIADLTPPPFNVRTRVHEYGGGSYTVSGGVVVFSNFADNRLYRLDPGADQPVPITPDGPWRFADLRVDPRRLRVLAVREDHAGPGDAAASIVAIQLNGANPPEVLVRGPDFLAAPRLSPDGLHLAWLEWDHPDMPWDGSRLRTAAVAVDGTLGEPALAAGGLDESIVSPSGPRTASSTSSRIEPGGGTCTGCSRARCSTRWGRWTPSSPTLPGCSGARPSGSCPMVRSRPSAGSMGATTCSTPGPAT